MAQNKPKRKLPKGIFYDSGAYWLQYFVNGQRFRERIGPNLVKPKRYWERGGQRSEKKVSLRSVRASRPRSMS